VYCMYLVLGRFVILFSVLVVCVGKKEGGGGDERQI
jgi:hypothetical protein